MILVAAFLSLIPVIVAVKQCGRHTSGFFDECSYSVGGRGVLFADSVVSVQVFRSSALIAHHS